MRPMAKMRLLALATLLLVLFLAPAPRVHAQVSSK